MTRKPRVDFPGAWHHVMHKGARRAPIFHTDEHCGLFLNVVEEMIHGFEIEVHAYALMPNHYHLLVRSRHGNISEGMRHLNGSYTKRVNLLHRWDGPVFRGRFRSEPIRDESRLPYVFAYIHLNPLRAHLVTRVDGDCWTSHRAYLGRLYAPNWITKDYFLDLFGDGAKLQDYILSLHRGKQGWPEEMELDQGFFKKNEQAADKHAQAKFESRFIDSERVLKLVAEHTGTSIERLREVRRGPYSNPSRRFAVWALREQTLLNNREIAAMLDMSPYQVSNVLSRFNKSEEPFRSWIEGWVPEK